MIVLDASALVALLIGDPATAPGIRSRLSSPGEAIHAPELVDLEVLSALRRLVRAQQMTDRRAAEAVADLARLRLQRHSHQSLLARIWQLRPNLTPYDAAYVALAEGLGAPFLTLDEGLARAVRRHSAATVELA